MNKKALIIVVSIIVLIMGSHFYFQRALEKSFLQFVEVQDKNGVKITYDSYQTQMGFFQLSLILKDPKVHAEQDWVEKVQVDGGLILSLSLFNPMTVRLHSQGKTQLAWKSPDPVVPWEIECEEFYGTTSLNDQRCLDDTRVGLKKVRLHQHSKDHPLLSTDLVSLGFEKEHEKKEFQFQLSSSDLTVDSSLNNLFGNRIESLTLRAKTTDLQQTIELKDTLQKWYEASGTVEIEDFKIKWGSLNLESQGTLTLDESLQPILALSAEIKDLKEVLHSLVTEKIISKKSLTLVNLVLGALGERKEEENIHKFALTLQEGELSLGPIPLIQGLKVNWG